MSASISRYLKDFSAPKMNLAMTPPRYFPDLDDDLPGSHAIEIKPQPEPRIDIEAERREAFAEGRAQAQAEQQALHAADTAALNERHATELEALRRRYEDEAAAAIYGRFSEIGSYLATMVSNHTARMLAPVMDEMLREKAVADLAVLITQSIGAGEGCKITVKGPSSMFEALKAHLGDETLVFRHQEAADPDLSVEFGDSILVMRMAAWADNVRKVLA